MILAINCGNTRMTVGCVDSNRTVKSVFRIPTDKKETDFGYAAKIKQILELQGVTPDQLRGAALSSVVPSLTDTLVRALRILSGTEPLVIGAGIKTGLHLCINDPGTVAADLVVTAIAVKEEYPLPSIVVDMGTATTLSALDATGKFIGCAIAPGVSLALDALVERTALLPNIEIKPPKNAIGTNTADCMKSGILYGAAGAVDGLIERFESEMNPTPATLVVTGENAEQIFPYCRHTLFNDPHLALKGLRIVWDKQRTAKQKN